MTIKEGQSFSKNKTKGNNKESSTILIKKERNLRKKWFTCLKI